MGLIWGAGLCAAQLTASRPVVPSLLCSFAGAICSRRDMLQEFARDFDGEIFGQCIRANPKTASVPESVHVSRFAPSDLRPRRPRLTINSLVFLVVAIGLADLMSNPLEAQQVSLSLGSGSTTQARA